MLGEQLLIGIISGIIIAASGYLKSRTVEEFDVEKFTQTVMVGAVIGFIMGALGWEFQKAEQFALDMGLIQLVENLKKAAIRHFKK